MEQSANIEQVVIVDLAEVSTNPELGTVTLTSTGEVLLSGPRGSGRATAAHMLDSVAATARAWRCGAWCRIALYNPFTARVSLGAAGTGVVLWAEGPLLLNSGGTVATFDPDLGELTVGDQIATIETPTRELITSQLYAHER